MPLKSVCKSVVHVYQCHLRRHTPKMLAHKSMCSPPLPLKTCKYNKQGVKIQLLSIISRFESSVKCVRHGFWDGNRDGGNKGRDEEKKNVTKNQEAAICSCWNLPKKSRCVCVRAFFAPHSLDVSASEVSFNSLQKPLPLGYDYFSINSILRFNKRATVSNMFPYDDAPILFGQRCCNGFFPSIFFSLDVPFTSALLNINFFVYFFCS